MTEPDDGTKISPTLKPLPDGTIETQAERRRRRVRLFALHLGVPFLAYHLYMVLTRLWLEFNPTSDYVALVLITGWTTFSALMSRMRLRWRWVLAVAILLGVGPGLFMYTFLFLSMIGEY